MFLVVNHKVTALSICRIQKEVEPRTIPWLGASERQISCLCESSKIHLVNVCQNLKLLAKLRSPYELSEGVVERVLAEFVWRQSLYGRLSLKEYSGKSEKLQIQL